MNAAAGQIKNSQDSQQGDGHVKQFTVEEFNEATLQKWLQTFNNLNSTLATLQGEIRSFQKFKGEFKQFTPTWKDATDRGIKLLEDKVDYQDLQIHMSHFAYVCKMRCLLNLVLESWEYLWFYLTFWIAILDCDLKLHKLSIHTLVMLQK